MRMGVSLDTEGEKEGGGAYTQPPNQTKPHRSQNAITRCLLLLVSQCVSVSPPFPFPPLPPPFSTPPPFSWLHMIVSHLSLSRASKHRYRSYEHALPSSSFPSPLIVPLHHPHTPPHPSIIPLPSPLPLPPVPPEREKRGKKRERTDGLYNNDVWVMVVLWVLAL